MAAGDTLFASDFGPISSDTELADETAFTSTSYIAGGTPCGATFVVPNSGSVLIVWMARFQCNTANQRAIVSVSVRTGGVLGSGTVVSGSDDDNAIETSQGTTGGVETRTSAAMQRTIGGLIAGDTYNVQIEHKTFGGNSTIFARRVDVMPWPAG